MALVLGMAVVQGEGLEGWQHIATLGTLGLVTAEVPGVVPVLGMAMVVLLLLGSTA